MALSPLDQGSYRRAGEAPGDLLGQGRCGLMSVDVREREEWRTKVGLLEGDYRVRFVIGDGVGTAETTVSFR